MKAHLKSGAPAALLFAYHSIFRQNLQTPRRFMGNKAIAKMAALCYTSESAVPFQTKRRSFA